MACIIPNAVAEFFTKIYHNIDFNMTAKPVYKQLTSDKAQLIAKQTKLCSEIQKYALMPASERKKNEYAIKNLGNTLSKIKREIAIKEYNINLIDQVWSHNGNKNENTKLDRVMKKGQKILQRVGDEVVDKEFDRREEVHQLLTERQDMDNEYEEQILNFSAMNRSSNAQADEAGSDLFAVLMSADLPDMVLTESQKEIAATLSQNYNPNPVTIGATPQPITSDLARQAVDDLE